MNWSLLFAWFTKSITYGTGIMYGTMGEIVTEKSGGMNLGTPGIMAMGGAAGFLAGYFYGSVPNPNPIVCILLVMLSAIMGGILGSAVFSFLTITLRANQNVTGLALTTFGVGLAKFFGLFALNGKTDIKAEYAASVFSARIPGLSDIPVAGELLFSYGFMTYLAVLLAVVITFIMQKTRVGLKLRAVGENPATADSVGINVTRYRYVSTLIGGALCGLGGLYYIVSLSYGSWSTETVTSIEALGWLAVALVIFAAWKSTNAIWGAYIFGVCFWAYMYLPGLFNIKIDTNLFQMLPYVVTIIVLIVGSLRKKKENQPPAALGLPYFREDR